MHLELAPPSTAPPRRLIAASQTNGLAWVVWRELDDFLFEVSPLRAPAAPLHTSPAEYSTAHKAERAAKFWCEAYVPMPPTGEVGPEQPDYESPEMALDAASVWAGRNSTKAEQEDQRASAAMDAALAGDDMSTPFDGPGEWTTELVAPVDPPAEPDEVSDLRARLVLAEAQLAAALARAPEDAAAEYLELATREAELETQITGTKEILAGLKAELTRIRRSMTKKAVSTMERISGRAPTAQLEIGGILGTVREAGLEIASHRVNWGAPHSSWRSTRRSTWHSPIVGTHAIEHSVEQSPVGELVVTWIAGHREQTEAHGETYETAAEDTKRKALEHFANKPGVRFPPAKSTSPKLKGHDQAAVLAAVARTDTTVAASIELGCSPFQLEKYAEKQGITLKLPAPPAAKASKPRGRKGGAK
jgi:hypothetical protein